MSELPKGWAAATLNDLLGAGGLFSDGDWVESKDQDPDGQNRLLQLADIGDGFFVDKSSRFVNDEKFSSLNCTEVKEGDVLIARMPDPLGRACLMPAMPQRCLTVVDVAVFRVGETGVSNKWLMHFLNSSPVRREIELNSSGTTRKRISRGKLGEILLPVPPLAEQTRIAAKLDELLAQVDTLKARIDGIPALLKRFRQSVLAAAVSGRLTEEWRAQYSSGEWQNMKVGELCKLKSGIAISADIEKAQGDFKYFKVGEMNLEGNELLLQRTDRYLARDDAPEKSLMPAGAIVFPKRGGAIATNKKRILKDASFVDLNVMGIVVPEGIEALYVYRWFETVDLAKLNTGSTIPQVNNTDIAPLVIPLPPLGEQTEIVRRVEQLFAFADQLEAKVSEARTRIDRLTQSILAKAFRGELVPQDPDDEPASVLLQLIQAQRVSAPKAKRGRKERA